MMPVKKEQFKHYLRPRSGSHKSNKQSLDDLSNHEDDPEKSQSDVDDEQTKRLEDYSDNQSDTPDSEEYESDSRSQSEDDEDDLETDEREKSEKSESFTSWSDETSSAKSGYHSFYFIPLVIVISVIVLTYSMSNPEFPSKSRDIFNANSFKELRERFSDHISERNLRIIRNRLLRISKEISVLTIVGNKRDIRCTSDPTFCIGEQIANSTINGYGFVDASSMTSVELRRRVDETFGLGKYAMMVDGLESLVGSEAPPLIGLVDSDHSAYKNGLIVFTIYGGNELQPRRGSKSIEEQVENFLAARWSRTLEESKITPVLSRIIGSVVEIY